jgi:hypothetical protein
MGSIMVFSVVALDGTVCFGLHFRTAVIKRDYSI